ncbi:uncharacterized protein LOC131857337 [Cryptomeria japonica]|uniref:uncharacterized protein LOC131857337 n=1 Tax=Cryptomeria japonica TaxID=3369 RepID=UPI0027D9F668|nr:uncharacterized protein LOC131857337 [Cryptomeria japonica]
MGDVNTPLKECEKFGRIVAQLGRRMDLMNFIDNQALYDVDLQGANFTWMNRQVGADLIQIISLFILWWILSWEEGTFCSSLRKCGLHLGLQEAIKDWWSILVNGTAMYRVAKKMRYVKDMVKKWNKEVFGDIFASKSAIWLELKDIQAKIQADRYNKVSINAENEILTKYDDIISKEEELWRQSSRSLG